MKVVDTTGRERFHSLIPTLIRRSQGILLVYDVNDPSLLLEGVPEMLQFIDENRADIGSLILAGNKADLMESEQSELVVSKEGEHFAQNCGILSLIEAETIHKMEITIDKVTHKTIIYWKFRLVDDVDVYACSRELESIPKKVSNWWSQS